MEITRTRTIVKRVRKEEDTTKVLFDLYGTFALDLKQLSELMHLSTGHIRNQISSGTFQIPTYRVGKKLLADIRDVAEWADRRRRDARRIVQV